MEKVDHLLGEFTIPSHVTPEKVTTHIIDTSSIPAPLVPCEEKR